MSRTGASRSGMSRSGMSRSGMSRSRSFKSQGTQQWDAMSARSVDLGDSGYGDHVIDIGPEGGAQPSQPKSKCCCITVLILIFTFIIALVWCGYYFEWFQSTEKKNTINDSSKLTSDNPSRNQSHNIIQSQSKSAWWNPIPNYLSNTSVALCYSVLTIVGLGAGLCFIPSLRPWTWWKSDPQADAEAAKRAAKDADNALAIATEKKRQAGKDLSDAEPSFVDKALGNKETPEDKAKREKLAADLVTAEKAESYAKSLTEKINAEIENSKRIVDFDKSKFKGTKGLFSEKPCLDLSKQDLDGIKAIRDNAWPPIANQCVDDVFRHKLGLDQYKLGVAGFEAREEEHLLVDRTCNFGRYADGAPKRHARIIEMCHEDFEYESDK